MIEEEYFKQRFIDVYEYSLMNYKSGTGTFRISDKEFQVKWESVIPITGECIFVISSEDSLGSLLQSTDIGNGELTGITDDREWSISTKLIITNINFKTNIPSIVLTCLVRILNLVKVSNNEINKKYLRGYITNFDFLGMEFTIRGERRVRDKFTVNVHDRQVVFQELEHKKLILEQINSNRIDKAILSTITFPILDGENKEQTSHYIELISWFLSLVNVKATMVPLIEYYDNNNEIAEIEYHQLLSSRYHPNVIIDNHLCFGGLIQYFNECYQVFVELDNDLALSSLVTSILGMYEGKFLENKLAGLILSYELLLTKYLVKSGSDFESIKELSIQDKLRRVNTYLRFIPSHLLADTLRKDVRNALFHTGEISVLSLNEKIEIYNEYYDLLIQITLRILNYRGKYINPKDYTAIDLL
ncbi:hypothetical protein GRF59_06945 [Paenibacillus sp. HJL G12]|uniref:ApeA N-terminal domain-containing protein n=1 Tax=Paenibacillus dendrobii TaxID=2691084 RepID=A0A7X3IJV4_9BACL|nr:hypothetical protein [Paenibacillus dendrobii]MWV43367.1 hypothetical protein [Paenibacillus dendrobii]